MWTVKFNWLTIGLGCYAFDHSFEAKLFAAMWGKSTVNEETKTITVE